MARILYKPFSTLFGIVGGVAAGAVFKRIWAAVAHDEDAPEPTEEGRGWHWGVAPLEVEFEGEPLCHYSARQDVVIWAPESV